MDDKQNQNNDGSMQNQDPQGFTQPGQNTQDYMQNVQQNQSDMNQQQPPQDLSGQQNANEMQQQNFSEQEGGSGDSSQDEFRPFSAFPANVNREYDQNIYNMIFDLVESKYRPHAYLERMRQLEAENKIPKLDEPVVQALENAGPDIDLVARDFEVARVYNKLEIEVFERSTYGMNQEQKNELQRITEEGQAQANQGNTVAQEQLIKKIQEYMQSSVPDIQNIVNDYMVGFRNQYLAGRF